MNGPSTPEGQLAFIIAAIVVAVWISGFPNHDRGKNFVKGLAWMPFRFAGWLMRKSVWLIGKSLQGIAWMIKRFFKKKPPPKKKKKKKKRRRKNGFSSFERREAA